MPKQRKPLDPYDAAYLDQGKGAPILFLHGFLGEGSCWLPIMEHLPQNRCIALDLLGFGNSSKPDLHYNIWHQVSFVQKFVQALGLEEFWLVGHSYGGWTAAAYAIAHTTGRLGFPNTQTEFPLPHNALAGLALVAPAGIRDDQFTRQYNRLRPLLWETPWIDWGLKVIAPVASRLGQQESFAQVSQFRQAIKEQPVAKSFLRDRLKPEDAIDTVETHLSKITVPTLIIAAQQDTTIPLWHCQTYAEGISGAQFVSYEDADHGLLQTHPSAIAQQITTLMHQGT
jgi:pimeloyl-ACP methyl ester carboxylesterase